MRPGSRSLAIAGGLIGAVGLGYAVWRPVLEGRVSASDGFRTAAIAAAAVGLGTLVVGRSIRGARARAAAGLVQWTALPASIVLWLGWYFLMNSGTKEYAYRALMQTELRNLAQAEESFHLDSGRYAADTASLGSSWGSWSDVVGPTITLTADGFQAVVGYESTNSTCAVFVGSTRLAPATQAGAPECSPVSQHRPWLGWAVLGVGLLIGGVGIATAGRPAASPAPLP
jgi:hypothetical protein